MMLTKKELNDIQFEDMQWAALGTRQREAKKAANILKSLNTYYQAALVEYDLELCKNLLAEVDVLASHCRSAVSSACQLQAAVKKRLEELEHGSK